MTNRRLFLVAALVTSIVSAYLLLVLPNIDESESVRQGAAEKSSTAVVPRPDLDPVDDVEIKTTAGSQASSTMDAMSHPVESAANEPGSGEIIVSGVVSDEYNQAIENVLVADEFKLGSTRTDSSGWYQIKIEIPSLKLPLLNFRRTGYKEDKIGLAVIKSNARSKVELDVILELSEDTTTVDGWLGNESGVGLGGLKIELRSKGREGTGFISYALLSEDDGEFSFEGIRSDHSYRLRVESSDGYAGYTLDPIWVTKHRSRITIILDSLRLIDVDGMIVDTDNSPVANFSITVQSLTTDYPDRKISSDSSGYFKLQAFPAGELKLSTNAPDYFKITGLNLRENEYRNLSLVIDKGAYHLSGWVSDENGAPLGKARVTLNSIFSIDDYQSYSYRSTSTDSNGGFEFSQLGGQSHTISVYAKGYQTHILNYDFTSFSDSLQISLIR
jgi:hypothetical protein